MISRRFIPTLMHRWALPVLVILCQVACAHGARKRSDDKIDVLPPLQSMAPLIDIEQHEALARAFFRKNKFNAALAALGDQPLSHDGQFIKGESLFRLGKFLEAKPHFTHLLKEGADAAAKRKAALRLFDIEIKQGNLEASIASYVAFQKEFKTPSARMRYALGKALYDANYHDKAKTVLSGIKKGNEYFARARYVIATIGLEQKDYKKSAKIFNQIEKLKPVSVEDYAVQQMAILAQGRLLVELGREDLAEKAYLRVSKQRPFGDKALSELIHAMVNRATKARLGEDKYKKTSLARREVIVRQSLESALHAAEYYQKLSPVDWHNPSLSMQVAALMVEVARYEDARLLLDELVGHFRGLEAKLVPSGQEPAMWPSLRLNFDQSRSDDALLWGVPNDWLKNLASIKEILLARDKIELSHNVLEEQLEAAKTMKIAGFDAFEKARGTQAALEDAYVRMVMKKQAKINKNVAEIINTNMADAEYLRARLVERQMADIKKQIGAVQSFQDEKIELFEGMLKKIDEGTSP